MNRTKLLLLAGTVLPAFALATPGVSAPRLSDQPMVLAQVDDMPGRGRGEGGGRPERPERPEKPARAERPDRPERPERPAAAERPERPERPAAAERPDRPEKPSRDAGDAGGRPDRPTRPERPAAIDKPDRPAAIDKPDRPSRGADAPDRTIPSARDRVKDAADTPDRSPSLKDKMRGDKPDAADRPSPADRASPTASDKPTSPDKPSLKDRMQGDRDKPNARDADKPTPGDRTSPTTADKPIPGALGADSLKDRMQRDRNARDKPDATSPNANDRNAPTTADKPIPGALGADSLKDRMQRDRNARDKPDATSPNANDRNAPPTNDRDANDRNAPPTNDRNANDRNGPNPNDRNANDRNSPDRLPNGDLRNPNDRNNNADRDRNGNDPRDRDRNANGNDRGGDSARDREDRNLDPKDRDRRDADRERYRNDDRYTIRNDDNRRPIFTDRNFNERDSRDRFDRRLQDYRRDARDDRDRQDFTIDYLRDQRRERRDGDRIYIDEPGGRTIIREGDRTYIRRDENERFRGLYDPRDFREERGEGGTTRTVITRPDGSQIITVTDEDGRLVSRTRRYNDQDYILIDNRPRPGVQYGPGGFIDLRLPPPRITIPREEYVVDADDASYDQIETAFRAPPVERIERSYSLDEIRQNAPLRERVRSVDLDAVNFATGSWDVADDQIKKLENVGLAMEAAIKKDPKTVFMVEGYTDAVGNDTDNLSLSDRRAESVAKILTKYFDLPAENLTTQGYGEQYLKVNTQGPEVRNRRVTIRNITPLLTSEK